MHEITVQGSAGNVLRGGPAWTSVSTTTSKTPHANLFTDIDAGEGTRLWECGGGAALGKNSGAWDTFWNIRARRARPTRPHPSGRRR